MIDHAKKIHCIGIGGIGVSALAALWRAQGKDVSGSDMQNSEIIEGLEKQGINVVVGPSAVSRQPSADLVVYSDAVPEDNVERVEARKRGIPEISYAQALGQVSREYKTIVVTGTHGKSTTTAMLGLILEAAGLDPLVLVGSKVPGWPLGNLRLPKTLTPNPLPKGEGESGQFPSPRGRGEGEGAPWFVVEGDDYRDHFLELVPYAVVVTSIEWDHPDYFRDLEHTVQSFYALVEKVSDGGLVIFNADDAGCKRLAQSISRSPIRANRRTVGYGSKGEIFATLRLQVPGQFNRYNATAAATAAMELGVSQDVLQKALGEFKGIWRRFEIIVELPPPLTPPRVPAGDPFGTGGEKLVSSPRGGEVRRGPITIISDYAHHPTAIRETMKAARQAYPNRRLVLVYQPHQHSRTKHLFEDFVSVLKDAADIVIVSEIYAVKGRMEDKDVSSQMIVERMENREGKMENVVLYGGDLAQTKRVVLENMKLGDVIIFMGAGDIDQLAREMVG